MKVYLIANERVTARIKDRLQLEKANKADVALIVRDDEVEAANAIGSVIGETNGMLPVVVMTGREDEIGQAYKKEAIEAGVPEHYILTGTHWRLSQLIKTLEALLKDPVLPDPLIFDYVPSWASRQVEEPVPEGKGEKPHTDEGKAEG